MFLRFALGARSPEKAKYFKSKLFYDPNEAKLPVSQQKARTAYPAGKDSSSLKALKNHPMSRDGPRKPRTQGLNQAEEMINGTD